MNSTCLSSANPLPPGQHMLILPYKFFKKIIHPMNKEKTKQVKREGLKVRRFTFRSHILSL